MNSNSRQAVLDMLLLCYENNTETKLKIKNNFILIKKKKKKKKAESNYSKLQYFSKS